MKKLFSTFVIAALLTGCAYASSESSANENLKRPPNMEKVRKQFEQRLNLTDKQKEKAKTIHKKGMEQMKPVMTQINAKRKEIFEIQKSNIEQTLKDEKISKLKEEIKTLDKKAREIRKKNSAEFEKILTKKQKKELEQMKAEGRENFEKHHPPRPPFNMFGAPDFWQKKPLFMPPKQN